MVLKKVKACFPFYAIVCMQSTYNIQFIQYTIVRTIYNRQNVPGPFPRSLEWFRPRPIGLVGEVLCQFPPAPRCIFQNPLPLVSVLCLQMQFKKPFQGERNTLVKDGKMNKTPVKLKIPKKKKKNSFRT